jgi:hypothetical protein
MRPARHRSVHDSEGVRFELTPSPIAQIVENASIAAWNAAAEQGSLDLGGHLAARRARSAAAFRDGLDPAHYVALARGRLQTLFGDPASRGDNHKSSFHYEIVASTPAGDVYFQVGDHKAADVLLFWEYTTSTADARRLAEQAFWTLVDSTEPSEFEDVFAYEESAGVRYGYGAGRPWIVTIAALAESRKSVRAPQPTGRVRLSGILSLALGAVVAAVAPPAIGPAGALAAGLTTWLVGAVAWQATSRD